ncbi:unnamed protein product [Rhizophagus irregularis]|nr:unnamed protein product [Rhizophagus irregularis]
MIGPRGYLFWGHERTKEWGKLNCLTESNLFVHCVWNKKIENEKGINNYYVSQRDHQTLDDANVANDANDANDSNDSNDLNDSNDSNYSK